MQREDPAVTRFRQYLRIKTVQPNPDYESCVTFFKAQAKEMQLPITVVYPVPRKPVIIITVEGEQPQLTSIMLNSHSDVVPVFEDKWSHNPFEAFKDEKGNIYARGAQDMKCVGMAYLEAIRNLMSKKVKFQRTIHVVFVPDEEIGGEEGMQPFLKHEEFKKLNVGFVLDEGLANPGEAFKLYYGERAPWWIKFKAEGNVGHGSQFIKDTAGSKLSKLIQKLLAFRDSEESRFLNGQKDNGESLTLGDVTTVNWTMASGGVQYNVVPNQFEAGFDIRVSPTLNLPKFEKMLRQWCQETGCTMEFVQYIPDNPTTPISDENPWWRAIREASDSLKQPLEVEIFPAATDSRFVRLQGIPAIGVSPINHTKVLLHDHDEFLNENVYLRGISWYEEVITKLSQVSEADELKSPKLKLTKQ